MSRSEGGAWRQNDKPLFDVQSLSYKLRGNNVPMPSTLVRHLLRVFIPELIQVSSSAGGVGVAGGGRAAGQEGRSPHDSPAAPAGMPTINTRPHSAPLFLPPPVPSQRRLLPLLPKEFGDYMLMGEWGLVAERGLVAAPRWCGGPWCSDFATTC